MSGIILFRVLTNWLTPYKFGRPPPPTFLGTFQNGRHRNLPKIELLISWPLVSLKTQIWYLNPQLQGH